MDIPFFVEVDTQAVQSLDSFHHFQDRLVDAAKDLRVRLFLSQPFDGVAVDATFSRHLVGVSWVFSFQAEVTRHGDYWLDVDLDGDRIPGAPFAVLIQPG